MNYAKKIVLALVLLATSVSLCSSTVEAKAIINRDLCAVGHDGKTPAIDGLLFVYIHGVLTSDSIGFERRAEKLHQSFLSTPNYKFDGKPVSCEFATINWYADTSRINDPVVIDGLNQIKDYGFPLARKINNDARYNVDMFSSDAAFLMSNKNNAGHIFEDINYIVSHENKPFVILGHSAGSIISLLYTQNLFTQNTFMNEEERLKNTEARKYFKGLITFGSPVGSLFAAAKSPTLTPQVISSYVSRPWYNVVQAEDYVATGISPSYFSDFVPSIHFNIKNVEYKPFLGPGVQKAHGSYFDDPAQFVKALN